MNGPDICRIEKLLPVLRLEQVVERALEQPGEGLAP